MITVDEVVELAGKIQDIEQDEMSVYQCYNIACKILEINSYREGNVLGTGYPSALEQIAMNLEKKDK